MKDGEAVALDPTRRRWRLSRPAPGFGADAVALVVPRQEAVSPPASARRPSRRPRQSTRSLPTEAQWADTMARLSKAVDDLTRWGPTLLDLARLSGRGYPTSSRGGGRGGGTSTDRCTCGHRTWEHEGACSSCQRCRAFEAPVALTPTEAAADARPDVDERLKAAMLDSEALGGVLLALHARISNLRPGGATGSDELPSGPGGQGHCVACGTFRSGARNDRLVAGMCISTCYRDWDKAGRPDRVAFGAQVRAESGRHLAAKQDRDGHGRFVA